jgi:hypothetical protein
MTLSGSDVVAISAAREFLSSFRLRDAHPG